MEVNLDLVIDICKSYIEVGLYRVYILDNISGKKLQNVVENFPLTGVKSVIMFQDTTVFGSFKTGIAVCDNGIFCKNDKLYIPSYRYFTWKEFSIVNIHLEDHNLFLGNDYYAFLPSPLKDRKVMEELLKKIQQALLYEGNQVKNKEEIRSLDKNQKISSKDNAWFLAIDQKQYGPMGISEIEKMIIDKFFNPEHTFAWKQGMDNWELFNNVPEFRVIVKGLNKNTIQPPPIPDFSNAKIPLISEKIDINNCKIEELLKIDCIDLKRANYFIEIRQKGKKFYTVEDIGNVLDLKPHEVEQLKNKIIFKLSKTLNGVRRIDF